MGKIGDYAQQTTVDDGDKFLMEDSASGETKYAVCTENGVQTPELEPLLPGSPED